MSWKEWAESWHDKFGHAKTRILSTNTDVMLEALTPIMEEHAVTVTDNHRMTCKTFTKWEVCRFRNGFRRCGATVDRFGERNVQFFSLLWNRARRRGHRHPNLKIATEFLNLACGLLHASSRSKCMRDVTEHVGTQYPRHEPRWPWMGAVLPDSACRIVVPICQMLPYFERKETSWARGRCGPALLLVQDCLCPRPARHRATGRTAQSCTRFSDIAYVMSRSMWELAFRWWSKVARRQSEACVSVALGYHRVGGSTEVEEQLLSLPRES